MKAMVLWLAVFSVGLGSGCAGLYSAPVVPGVALVYANTKAPIDIDANATSMGSKSGSAGVTTILGLFAFGDASVTTAAKSGGITTVHHVDYEYQSILGVYQRFTTVVRGD